MGPMRFVSPCPPAIAPGNEMRFTSEKVEASRNFANKLWNAARFLLMNLEGHEVAFGLPDTLTLDEKWILSRFNALVSAVTENLEKFELGLAVQKLYDFIWDNYCDWTIELSKSRLTGGDEAAAANARRVLLYVMQGASEAASPLYALYHRRNLAGPTSRRGSPDDFGLAVNDPALSFPEEEKEMERLMEAIRAIRNRRAEMNVPPSRKAQVYVETAFIDTFIGGTPFIQRLASASGVQVGGSFNLPGAVSIVTPDATIKIPMDELTDKEAERVRLQRERIT